MKLLRLWWEHLESEIQSVEFVILKVGPTPRARPQGGAVITFLLMWLIKSVLHTSLFLVEAKPEMFSVIPASQSTAFPGEQEGSTSTPSSTRLPPPPVHQYTNPE